MQFNTVKDLDGKNASVLCGWVRYSGVEIPRFIDSVSKYDFMTHSEWQTIFIKTNFTEHYVGVVLNLIKKPISYKKSHIWLEYYMH